MSLENRQNWIDKLNYCINLDNRNFSQLSTNEREFLCEWLEDSEIEENTLKVLDYSLGKTLEQIF